jgi:hypothetical protein
MATTLEDPQTTRPASLWAYTYDPEAENLYWHEVAVVHATSQFLWGMGRDGRRFKLCRSQPNNDGKYASRESITGVYTEAAMRRRRRPDEVVLTLSQQAAEPAGRQNTERLMAQLETGPKHRWYWVAFYWRRWLHLHGTPEYADTSLWLIEEGFTATQEEAVTAVEAAQAAAPGDYFAADSISRHLRHHRPIGNRRVRDVYRERHARKRAPSSGTDSRAEGALGYLWTRWYDSDYGDSGWQSWPITKITPKRIFIRRSARGSTQQSFDRAKLERNGSAFWQNGTGSEIFYADAGKAAVEAEWPRYTTERSTNNFPLLQLPPGFAQQDVRHRFRACARELHPDHGGDAVQFRALIAERDRALALAAMEAV